MIPFSPPRIDQKIIDEIIDTLNSGWITTGPKTKLFEQKLTEYTKCKSTLCVSSASAGLELVLRWFGVEEGDEVILPAYTYAATANVIVHCGAKPVFVDSDEDLNISVKAIRQAITDKTKVIIPVDIVGWPCDYDEINNIVREEEIQKKFKAKGKIHEKLGRILILSDAAHSLGGRYKNKKVGSLTDITVFSFHAVKNLTTAEGGAICLLLPDFFDNNKVYDELKIKSLHGQTKDAFSKQKIENWKYDIVEAGYKCNMTDIQAAMGLVEIERYDRDMLVKRKSIFDFYNINFSLKSWAYIPIYQNEDKESSYHVFALRIKGINEKQRNDILQEIFRRGVSANIHFIPLPMMSYYRSLGYNIDDYPQAYKNYECLISLPVYYDLTIEQQQQVVDAVIESVNTVNT